ncbi:MAG: homoserine kinase [Solirubrobacteraceae bacterium]|nr:homoserine kinase [Solirubrobacteraceae bacterium]
MSGGVRVRVPASTANLGPGFDVLACALDLWLELEVQPAPTFSFTTDLPVPMDPTNIAVDAFGRLGDPARVAFTMRSQIPLSGGMGSSAAARVAGVLAALVMGGEEPKDALELALAIAAELEGHADNAAAAIYGGVTVELPDGPLKLAVPQRLGFVIVAPHEAVDTPAARAALPAAVPMADAAFNVGQATALAAGLASRDLDLIARGLGDRLHQPHRAPLYPRSMELIASARELGALGGTVSGAGPTVLLWCDRDAVRDVEREAGIWSAGWADTLAVDPSERGAQIERL